MASAKTTLSKPASGRFILFTLVLGLLANLVPWNGLAKLLWPDCIALLLVYWIIYQPRHVGLSTAWFLGLLMDIADGVLFGQHALAYTLMAYLAQILHRRLQMFSPWQQSLYVFGLLAPCSGQAFLYCCAYRNIASRVLTILIRSSLTSDARRRTSQPSARAVLLSGAAHGCR
jgi:rod shape-determining protein MreD